ncbi:MAG: phosphoadenosine phosphosulfate reductase family protein [Clostridia bacterium]|nr:phosphoadenosine phosphosulfate reductase family protein [Clostridia bacterium]
MGDFMHTREELQHLQSLPLADKIRLTRERIREWVDAWNGRVYVSFSGGKDSTALLHMVRELYRDVPAVFSNTGLEFPEVRKFALSQPNVTEIRPEMTFVEVVTTEGYPLISKSVANAIKYARRPDPEGRLRRYMTGNVLVPLRDGTMGRSMFDKSRWQKLAEEAPFRISDKCCRIMKKRPMKQYERDSGRHGIVGTMAREGRLRERAWLQHGCNAYDTPHGLSTPLAFWTEQDMLEYIARMGIEIAPVYGEIECIRKSCHSCRYATTGADRTGCVFCCFGAHVEKRGRFVSLRESHPALYRYCMEGGQWIPNPDYDPDLPKYAEDGFKNWNPERLWVPSPEGLGMGFVLDTVNTLYGRVLIPG